MVLRTSIYALEVLASSALLGAAAHAAQGTAPCTSGVGCQIPDQQGWALADDNPGGGLKALDNFKVAADGAIGAVCWWGVYYDFEPGVDCGPGTGDEFSIAYYDDGCLGTPGSLRAGPFEVTLSSKAATGNVASSGGIVMAEYRYEASHPPITVQVGECLWIEILNHTTQECFWLWSTSLPADGRSALSGFFGTISQPFDLAFCVDVATAPDGCASTLADAYCSAKTNSLGCTPSMAAQLAGQNLVLAAQQVLPGEAGLLFYSLQGAAGAPFQGGFLCVQPPLTRTAVQTSGAAGAPPCTGTYAFDFTAFAASGADPALVGGQPVWVQYWSRDSTASFGSGLTNALTFTHCP